MGSTRVSDITSTYTPDVNSTIATITNNKDGSQKKIILYAGIGVAIFVVILCCCGVLIYCIRKKRRNSRTEKKVGEEEDYVISDELEVNRYEEVKGKSTNNIKNKKGSKNNTKVHEKNVKHDNYINISDSKGQSVQKPVIPSKPENISNNNVKQLRKPMPTPRKKTLDSNIEINSPVEIKTPEVEPESDDAFYSNVPNIDPTELHAAKPQRKPIPIPRKKPSETNEYKTQVEIKTPDSRKDSGDDYYSNLPGTEPTETDDDYYSNLPDPTENRQGLLSKLDKENNTGTPNTSTGEDYYTILPGTESTETDDDYYSNLPDPTELRQGLLSKLDRENNTGTPNTSTPNNKHVKVAMPGTSAQKFKMNLDNVDGGKFSEYVKVGREEVIYKAPSGVPKHEAPNSMPLNRNASTYVSMAPTDDGTKFPDYEDVNEVKPQNRATYGYAPMSSGNINEGDYYSNYRGAEEHVI